MQKSCGNEGVFLWGVSSSAFQVEGMPADSDWKRWTFKPGKIQDASTAEKVGMFWERYEDDIRLASELGSKCFRISVAWERIEPRPNEFHQASLHHYRKILDCIREYGMVPAITLNHFVLPGWLADKDGYLASSFSEDFCRYARKVFGELALQNDEPAFWMTFNEPSVLALQAFINGVWPPGHTNDFSSASKAVAQMAEAHISFVSSLRPRPNIRWGFAQHIRDFQPKTPNIKDRIAARFLHWIFNEQFIRSLKGRIFSWMPGSTPILKKIKVPKTYRPYDFMGINYYGRMLVSSTLKPPFISVEEGPGAKSDLGWEIYPEGLYNICADNFKKFKSPIFIMENGIADHKDRFRSEFISSHIDQIRRARAEGIPILGYLHWTLTDNFEWAEGLDAKFGLVDISENLERKPRESFYFYQNLIQTFEQDLNQNKTRQN